MSTSILSPDFCTKKDEVINAHPVITNNPYTKHIVANQLNDAQAIDLLIQFSVFSQHFLVIQCKRMANAYSEEAEREARVILVSELGVAFKENTDDVEGSVFSHRWAHINWLRETAKPFLLYPPHIPYRLGHWKLGTPKTHSFLKKLDRVYGNTDPSIAAGASFAIETWAGFGIGQNGEGAYNERHNFWKELLTGLERFNEMRIGKVQPSLKLDFFQFHFELESKHVASVERELEETYAQEWFNKKKWFQGATSALDAIYLFWEGLEKRRRILEH